MKNLFKPLLLNLDMSGKQVTSLRAGRASHTAHVTAKLGWVDTPAEKRMVIRMIIRCFSEMDSN